jgi:hypothetical protein
LRKYFCLVLDNRRFLVRAIGRGSVVIVLRALTLAETVLDPEFGDLLSDLEES